MAQVTADSDENKAAEIKKPSIQRRQQTKLIKEKSLLHTTYTKNTRWQDDAAAAGLGFHALTPGDVPLQV